MKSFWLKRQAGSGRLLAIYQGWGRSATDPAALPVPDDCDAVVFSDYTKLPEAEPEELAGYDRIAVFAWSLGVWAAAHTLSGRREKIASATAVNGTLEPLSREYGIAPEIFLGTAEHWLEPAVRRKFNFRMNLPAGCDSERTPEDQRQELFALADAVRRAAVPEHIFTRVVVGGRDRIFPVAAQLAAWRRLGTEPEVRPELGHWIWEEDWSDDAGWQNADR